MEEGREKPEMQIRKKGNCWSYEGLFCGHLSKGAMAWIHTFTATHGFLDSFTRHGFLDSFTRHGFLDPFTP
jgi:hypothetical protein